MFPSRAIRRRCFSRRLRNRRHMGRKKGTNDGRLSAVHFLHKERAMVCVGTRGGCGDEDGGPCACPGGGFCTSSKDKQQGPPSAAEPPSSVPTHTTTLTPPSRRESTMHWIFYMLDLLYIYLDNMMYKEVIPNVRTNIFNFRDLRSRSPDVLSEQFDEEWEERTKTRHGKPVMTIVPTKTYRELVETVELLLETLDIMKLSRTDENIP